MTAIIEIELPAGEFALEETLTTLPELELSLSRDQLLPDRDIYCGS